VWRERGHDVVTLDFDPRFEADIIANVLDFDIKSLGRFDVVLASPPCETFSVASIGHHWNKDKTPKTDQAILGLQIVNRTLEIIHETAPEFWIIENPRGMMRNVEPLKPFKRTTVTYCQYGEHRMKPTDLWHEMPPGFEFRPRCAKRAPCHVAAPRGSLTGTQGMKNYAVKSIIPRQLAEDVCAVIERWFMEHTGTTREEKEA
jgi:hypothetical protein